jgi:hypothetical protein
VCVCVCVCLCGQHADQKEGLGHGDTHTHTHTRTYIIHTHSHSHRLGLGAAEEALHAPQTSTHFIKDGMSGCLRGGGGGGGGEGGGDGEDSRGNGERQGGWVEGKTVLNHAQQDCMKFVAQNLTKKMGRGGGGRLGEGV